MLPSPPTAPTTLTTLAPKADRAVSAVVACGTQASHRASLCRSCYWPWVSQPSPSSFGAPLPLLTAAPSSVRTSHSPAPRQTPWRAAPTPWRSRVAAARERLRDDSGPPSLGNPKIRGRWTADSRLAFDTLTTCRGGPLPRLPHQRRRSWELRPLRRARIRRSSRPRADVFLCFALCCFVCD